MQNDQGKSRSFALPWNARVPFLLGPEHLYGVSAHGFDYCEDTVVFNSERVLGDMGKFGEEYRGDRDWRATVDRSQMYNSIAVEPGGLDPFTLHMALLARPRGRRHCVSLNTIT